MDYNDDDNNNKNKNRNYDIEIKIIIIIIIIIIILIIGNNDYLNRFLSNQLYMAEKKLDFIHINIIISKYSSFFENEFFFLQTINLS